MTPDYAPVTSPTGGNHFTISQYAGDGTTFLHDGVTFYQCTYRDELALQGSGEQDGSYLDAEIAVSYRPDLNVIHINGLDAEPMASLGACGGDYQLIIANALRGPLPACGVPWASATPVSGTLPPGDATDVTVTFDATGLAGDVYTGTLCIESNDPWQPLTTVPLTMTVIADADLWITKDAPAFAVMGATFSYTLGYGNDGPAPAFAVTVEDTLPAGVAFVSVSDPACTEAGGVVTCDLGGLAAGDSGGVEIWVLAVDAGDAVNNAAITSTSPDPDTSNNSDSATTTILLYRVYLPIVLR
jgi:uncharacterized repeat protein (TIGR01451 family)